MPTPTARGPSGATGHCFHVSLDVTLLDQSAMVQLLDEGAQLIEVLPAENYAAVHLPGAINIPLKSLDAQSSAVLDRSNPVVVYCWDSL